MSVEPNSPRSRHRLVVSGRAAERLEVGRVWLREREPLEECLVLGPSQSALRELMRRVEEGCFGVHPLTVGQWAQELASLELAGRGVSPVSELGLRSIATRVAYGAAAAQELDELAGVAILPGFARCLESSVRELRAAGIGPDQLDSEPATHELALLLERFGQELDSWGLADSVERLRAARRSLAEQPDRRLGGALWLDLQVWNRCTFDFLRSALSSDSRVVATVPAGDAESLSALEELLGVEAEESEQLDSEGASRTSSRLERVQFGVFEAGGTVRAESSNGRERGQREPGEPAETRSAPSLDRSELPEADPSVTFFSAAGEGQEGLEILRRVRDRAAAGVPFDRMAVLLRQPRGYQALLEDAFRRAGVPAYFSRGTTRPDPNGRAFLALLACAVERLSAERFAEYLSLGQTPPLNDEGEPAEREVPWVEPDDEQLVLKSLLPAPRLDASQKAGVEERDEQAELEHEIESPLVVPSRWERVLVDAAVVGGGDRWRRRLAGREAELRLQLDELEDDDEAHREALRRQLESLGALRQFALPVVEQLESLPELAPWSEWLGHLEGLATGSLRRPEGVLALLADLRPLADVTEVRLEDVVRTLEDRLGTLRVEPPRRQEGCVFVGLLGDVAGRSFDTVFVPGLAEGVFPARNSEDPLLLDVTRESLSAGSPAIELSRLPTEHDRSRRERLLLRLAVGAAERQLVISYPRIDLVLGRARVPSLYFLDVVRAADGQLPSLEQLATRAAAGAASEVGWPAPSRPEASLDETEFQLAILRELLAQDPGGSRGGARFLLEDQPHLARALRARAGRWRSKWFPDDGLVQLSEDTLELLEAQRPGRRSYSPTALQHFAACPYRFFLQAVHRLRPREALVRLEELDPLTRGSIFHSIQYRFVQALREDGLATIDRTNFDRASELLDRVTAEQELHFKEELAPAIDRVWRTEFEALRADLRGWLRVVADEEPSWQVLYGELGFGLPKTDEHDPRSVQEPVEVLGGALKLRGSIDWVEQDGRGRTLRVTDHKTGRAPQIEGPLQIGGGKILQPLLYGLAAEAIFGEEGQEVYSGRLFYCTQRGDYRVLEVALDLAGRTTLTRLVGALDASLEQGFLPASPAPEECRFCDYRLVCGPYEEARIRLKRDRTALEELDDLRRRP